MAGIGALGKGYEGQQIQGLMGYGDYLRQIQQQQMMDPYMRAQMGLGLMTPGVATGGAGKTTQTTQSNPGLFQTLLGTGLTLGGMGAFGPLGALAGEGLYRLTGGGA